MVHNAQFWLMLIHKYLDDNFYYNRRPSEWLKWVKKHGIMSGFLFTRLATLLVLLRKQS